LLEVRVTGRKKTDPRKNFRYTYVQGDPLQEEVVKGLKVSAMSELRDIDRNSKEKDIKKQNNIFETKSGLQFEKIMEGDIRLGRTILDAKSSNSNTDTILLEGQRLIRDALVLGAQAKSIYFCDPAVLESLPIHLLKDFALYKILYRDMKTWSDTTTPAGILGVFQKPQQGEKVSVAETVLPVTLIFDNVRDPGNAGTLIRTAAAVGCDRIITTKGSVNVWDCKVLRSAMGGHFSVPIYSGISWADVPNYMADNTQVFLANTWQSYMLTRSFDKKLQSEDLDKALCESELSESEDDDEDIASQPQENYLLAEKKASTFQKVPLGICEYSDIVLNQLDSNDERKDSVSVALVLGGEVEGLSAQAKKFAYSHYGQYVSIPMNNNTNSLNTGIAGSIILYELRRKLLALKTSRYPDTEVSNS